MRGWGFRATRGMVPPAVAGLIDAVAAAGHRCYVVGGAARALVSGMPVSDWDVATTATPSEVKAVFPDRDLVEKGERHGTVGIIAGDCTVEFTTLRTEASYSDHRRPDSVAFIEDIHTDLSRRDFTVNAFALEWPSLSLIDPFEGLRDMRRGILRAVGDPGERFAEDALRMMRAVRFVAQHGWTIEARTRRAIASGARLLGCISVERVRDEMSRLLLGEHVALALEAMVNLGLMREAIPEFERCVGYRPGSAQGEALHQHAICVASLVKPELSLRLAALLHDVAKPCTLVLDERGLGHFYGHDRRGAEIAGEALERMRYPRAVRLRVQALIREHMFFYNETVTDAAIRRLIARVGPDNALDLVELRKADVVASTFGAHAVLAALRRGGAGRGVSAAMMRAGDRAVARVRARVREVMKSAPSAGGRLLAVDGRDVIEILGIGPGPAVGEVLRRLTDLVMEDPSLNDRDTLRSIVRGMKPDAGPREDAEDPDG